MEEIWKSAPFAEGYYEISNLGRMRRIKPGKRTMFGRILKPQWNLGGYQTYNMTIDGKNVTKPVHRLVTEAFFGKRQEGMCVNHKNGNKKDNHIENLEYVTYHENSMHRARVLRKGIGVSHGMAKLTEDQVRFIRSSPNQRGMVRGLARIFKVNHKLISLIRQRKIWKHVV